MKKLLDIFIQTTIPGTYRVVLFNALMPQTEVLYPGAGINNQPSFLSDQKPALAAEGQLAMIASGTINGTISWAANFMWGENNAGTQYFNISCKTVNFTYRSLLEWLKTTKIKVGKVKLTSADTTQLKKDWKIVRRFPDSTVQEEDVILANMITPDQVNQFVVEFNLNQVIDKYTAIEMDITPNQLGFRITMEYEEI